MYENTEEMLQIYENHYNIKLPQKFRNYVVKNIIPISFDINKEFVEPETNFFEDDRIKIGIDLGTEQISHVINYTYFLNIEDGIIYGVDYDVGYVFINNTSFDDFLIHNNIGWIF